MDPLLQKLNAAQREAVLHVDGPLLILAGPGSGKTRVVTHRIAHLLKQGVHASQILALTFTNKAAQEMRRRVEQLAPGERVWVSTFHRFGARLLRERADLVGLGQNFTIYDTSDSRQTLKRVIEAEKIPTMHYTADRIAAGISSAKNKLITADEYQPRSSSPLSSVVARAYPAYQERLLASSAVDFDDLLLHVAKLLKDNPEVRAELDSRFRYVLVDEYQDTNRAQYVILRALSLDYPNLAATGDPDQSIYGWRGADLNNILDFEKDYGQAKVIRLEQNYRSTKAILRAADMLIGHNQRRKKKALFTENDEGAPIRLVTYADQDAEASAIAQQIRAAIDSGERKASDFAVFYRINALSRSVERALRAHRVPFQMVRGQEFYQRKEIKDVLAYCQLINNPKDDVAFVRTVNSPTRGIGKKTLDALNDHAYRYGTPLLDAAREAGLIEGLAKRSATKLSQFVALVEKLASRAAGPVEEVIGSVITESGYRQRLVDSDDEEDASRLANIEELLTDARQFDEESEGEFEGGAGLEEYLERTWLVNETDNWEDDSDKVTLMTLHAAKGLEFPVVYLVAVEDGILPHERSSMDTQQLEEERRLAFVGITRAEQQLQLSLVRRRDFRGQRRMAVPSSFLMEMPTAEMDTDHGGQTFEIDPWEQFELPPEEEVWTDPNAAEPEESKPSISAAITTAAELSGEAAPKPSHPPQPHTRFSPDDFSLDMTVRHPEYGLGKIKSLSGAGKRRAATVEFALAGERRIVLAHSPLEPVGNKG
ncbi:ATP-dependent DNA helicase PcrA [Posidoniimonas polymericola]|uniref:DNA 3'-5' helicase n=1 Tax=Posidoniimonas polymericola TaxID=2528002 RepID=A0A5C5YKM4_9BACT|nr:UvrD-helicase domain-containing protein [Posidoniimonas polymericola]TWT75463.1 ATP-dependent DNA helicase PcrA [Posidoniimonas polymericola]